MNEHPSKQFRKREEKYTERKQNEGKKLRVHQKIMKMKKQKINMEQRPSSKLEVCSLKSLLKLLRSKKKDIKTVGIKNRKRGYYHSSFQTLKI